MTGDQRPIGYWLKHLDRLIDGAFDQAFTQEGLGRREWQVMNVVAAAPADVGAIAEALRPFWGDDSGPANTLEVLRQRGWIACEEGGRYSLTPRGVEAHQAAAGRVAAIRTAVTTSLTPGEYAEAIRLLQRMSANLQAARQLA